VNDRLKKEYKKLFAAIDYFIFMKMPSFKMVFKWRLLQEKKLRKKSVAESLSEFPAKKSNWTLFFTAQVRPQSKP